MIASQSQKRTPAAFTPFPAHDEGACVQTKFCPPTHDQIERRAYEIYVANGRPEGHSTEYWSEAESQLALAPAFVPAAQAHQRAPAL
jgi:hypothetical protein